MIDLDAIRKRDERFPLLPSCFPTAVHDRRALLAYVDEQEKYVQELREDLKLRLREAGEYAERLDALREAAKKVTCAACGGYGSLACLSETGHVTNHAPCPDCAGLRALLKEKP